MKTPFSVALAVIKIIIPGAYILLGIYVLVRKELIIAFGHCYNFNWSDFQVYAMCALLLVYGFFRGYRLYTEDTTD